MRRRTKTNIYLNNKDLIKEIHKSKISYCFYEDKKYTDYDYVFFSKVTESLESINEFSTLITDEIIEQAKENRAKRLNEEKGDHLFHVEGWTNKKINDYMEENAITADDIKTDDIVFRFMTHQHIPKYIDKNNKEKYETLNFPPFIHIAKIDDSYKCVLKSHHNKAGEFSIIHGKFTNNLAMAFMLLIDKFGNKHNWRGYSWLDEMKGAAIIRLSQVGIQFDETVSNNPFSWYTIIIERCFIGHLNSEKKYLELKSMLARELNDEMLMAHGESAQEDIDNYYKDNKMSKMKVIYSKNEINNDK